MNAVTDRPHIDDSILEKIESMLRMAEKGRQAADDPTLTEAQRAATVEEANRAAEMAQKWMLQHHVSQAMLSKEERSALGEHLIRSNHTGTGYFWQKDLLKGLAQTNFCRVWNMAYATDSHGTECFDRAEIIGYENDVKLVNYLFGYLFREIRRLGKEYIRSQGSYKIDDWGRTKRRTSHDDWVTTLDFGRGAVITIVQRLEAERRANEEELRTENVSSTAIIVARDSAVDDYYYQKLYHMTKAEYEHKQRQEQRAYLGGRKLGAAGGQLEESLLAQWETDNERSYFKRGWQNGHSEYENNQLEAKYASGELKRPKLTGPSSRGGRGHQYYGRTGRKVDGEAYTSGQQAAQHIPLRRGVEGGKVRKEMAG